MKPNNVQVAASTLLAWLGLYVHNRIELPQITLLSPENSLTGLVFLFFLAAWWLLPHKRFVATVTLVWAVLHLLGGAIITMIPFPFLPFYPEQSLVHYLAHIFYGLAQLPLIVVMFRQVSGNQ